MLPLGTVPKRKGGEKSLGLWNWREKERERERERQTETGKGRNALEKCEETLSQHWGVYNGKEPALFHQTH